MNRGAQERSCKKDLEVTQRIMTAFYSIDSDNCVAVHPDKAAAVKEAGASGTAFGTEAKLSEETALWPASKLVEVWNSFAGAPPFADLKEVRRFTNRKSAVTRIWNAVQRLGKALEDEQKVAAIAPAPVAKAAKAIVPAAVAPTAPAQASAKANAPKDAASKDDAPAPKHREGTRMATVIGLLERAGGATLEELMAETGWQKHSVRGFISTLGSKHGYEVVSTRRESDKARVYSIAQ
jgi:hypothetical protein